MTDDITMDFGQALHLLLTGDCHMMRRVAWTIDVEIRLICKGEVCGQWIDDYSQHLIMESNEGTIPWIPNMVEMCISKDWTAFIYDEVGDPHPVYADGHDNIDEEIADLKGDKP
jgi:hypothetical protein